MLRILFTLEKLAAEAQTAAELDSKCIDYAFHLGPDDLEEIEQLMGTVPTMQIQH